MPRLSAYLVERRAEALAVLRRTVPLVVSAAEDFTGAEFEAMGLELLDAAELLVSAAAMLRRRPTNTNCICRKCKTVMMPAGPIWDSFRHCGFIQAPWGVLALPPDFWDEYLPGEKVRGAVLQSEWAEDESVDNRVSECRGSLKRGKNRPG